jgi:hypothetical protein
MALDPVTAILNVGNSLIDRLLPDKSANDAAKAELLKMQVAGEFQQQTQELQAQVQTLQAINATMQDESKSAHWLQWAWRPIFGITGAAVIVNNYILLPYLQAFGIKPIEIPDITWQVILAVVGVSALTRGGEKIAAVLKNR